MRCSARSKLWPRRSHVPLAFCWSASPRPPSSLHPLDACAVPSSSFQASYGRRRIRCRGARYSERLRAAAATPSLTMGAQLHTRRPFLLLLPPPAAHPAHGHTRSQSTAASSSRSDAVADGRPRAQPRTSAAAESTTHNNDSAKQYKNTSAARTRTPRRDRSVDAQHGCGCRVRSRVRALVPRSPRSSVLSVAECAFCSLR